MIKTLGQIASEAYYAVGSVGPSAWERGAIAVAELCADIAGRPQTDDDTIDKQVRLQSAQAIRDLIMKSLVAAEGESQ